MKKSSKSAKVSKFKKQVAAWHEARIHNYVITRSPLALATMVVELENSGTCLPEFEIDEQWPAEVRHMRVK